MDLRTVGIVTGVFVLIVAGFLAFLIYSAADGPVSATDSASADTNPRKQLEEYVLSGFTVEFWAEGRPFVSYYDPGAQETARQDIYQALFWLSTAGENLHGMGASLPSGPIDPWEAAYRLGLLKEHGLFGYSRDLREALSSYETARRGGHAKGAEAASRLEGSVR